jgi:hypothetical protein
MTGGTGTSSGQFQNVTLFEFADGGDDGDVTFATSHSSVCTGHQARRGCRIQSRRHLATGSPASRANLLLASELTRPQSTAQFIKGNRLEKLENKIRSCNASGKRDEKLLWPRKLKSRPQEEGGATEGI